MSGRHDERGVSEVIGFILIFGFLIVAFSLYQGIVVPDQNRVVEFDHNQAVQGQLQDLRNAIMGAAFGGAEQTVGIKLGADYPPRTLARNLGYSGGSLTTSTVGTGEIVIKNAVAVDRYGETADYWNGTAEHRFDSKGIVYEPTYSRYTAAPVTSYENTLAYNDFGDGTNLSITGEALVDGKRITLVSIVGNLSESGRDTISVDPEAISASTERIAIRNESHPVNITIPTRLSQSWWEEMLQDEMDNGHVMSVEDTGTGQVSILLEAGTTYTLRLAKIGVGSSERDEGVEYLTLTERPSKTVFNDTSHSITVQARDKYNNPVSGVLVNASVGNPDGTNNGTFAEWSISTGTDGEATFNYTANDSGTDELWFNVTSGGDLPDYRTVRVNLDVKSSSGGGGGGGGDDGSSTINPSEDQKTLVFINSTVPQGGSDTVTLFLNNTADSNITIDKARFQFYSFTQSSETEAPGSVDIDDPANNVPYLGRFTPVSGVTISPGVHSLSLTFYYEDDSGYTVEEGDFAIFTFETGGGERITYYIGMTVD